MRNLLVVVGFLCAACAAAPSRAAAVVPGRLITDSEGVKSRIEVESGTRGLDKRASRGRTKVLICFDGTAYALIARLWDEGCFRIFHRPSRLISTFPAITEIMLTELYGVPGPSGYGLRYFDKERNRMVGGIAATEELGVWFRIYDYVTPMASRGLYYLSPSSASLDVEAMREVIRDRMGKGQRIITMHLDGTDAVGHIAGYARVEQLLRQFDRALEEIYLERQGDLDIVVFSDHGMSDSPCTRIGIEEHLKKSGFVPRQRLEAERDVVLLPTGLISCGYLYASDTCKPELARTLMTLEGVDFSCYRRGDAVVVTGRRGTAVIERRGDRFRYQPVEGDPLALNPVLDRLAAAGAVDADGFVADRELAAATWEHAYPDAVNRVYYGTTGHVRNVGDVMVSLEDGYQCGSKVMSAFLRFKGTHGSVTKKSITGFVMSTDRALPPSLRAEDLLDLMDWEGFRRGHIDTGTVKSSAW